MVKETPVPSEETKKRRIICFSLLALSIIALVLVAIFAPNAEFDYLFGTTEWVHILILAVVIMIGSTVFLYDEKREPQKYLTPGGELDTATPRRYLPMQVNFLSKILGKENIFGQTNLDEFKYSDGTVYVRNSKGHTASGALKDLTFIYKYNKNKLTDEWYIYQYKIIDKSGNSVRFNRHNSLFNDEEYSDIEMILSLCGTVQEAKMSKFTKKLDKILQQVNDVDFSDTSASELIADGAMNKIGKLAKAKLNGKKITSNSKFKTILKKIWQVILIILLAVYVLAVLYVNIAHIFTGSKPELFTADDIFATHYDYPIDDAEACEVDIAECVCDDNYADLDTTSCDEYEPAAICADEDYDTCPWTLQDLDGYREGHVEMRGWIAEAYIHMFLNELSGKGYWYYEDEPGKKYWLEITEIGPEMEIRQVNSSEQTTGYFKGTRDKKHNISGTYYRDGSKYATFSVWPED